MVTTGGLTQLFCLKYVRIPVAAAVPEAGALAAPMVNIVVP